MSLRPSPKPILTLCSPQEIHFTWAGYEYRFYNHSLDYRSFPTTFNRAPHRAFLLAKNSATTWDRFSISAKEGEGWEVM
jgi:hypothetical protein